MEQLIKHELSASALAGELSNIQNFTAKIESRTLTFEKQNEADQKETLRRQITQIRKVLEGLENQLGDNSEEK